MPSLRCPHCNTVSWFNKVWHANLPPESKLASGRLVFTEGGGRGTSRVLKHPNETAALKCYNEECGAVLGALFAGKELITYWPKALPDPPEFPDVPDHIAEAAGEAHYVNSLGAHRAAGALARAVIEAVAKERGITEGKIYDKIEEMARRELIREDTRQAAHEVRHFGNDMAHGDFVDPVDPEEAADILDLMDELLAEVYQAPAKVERVRERRKAREEAKKQGQLQSAAEAT